MTFTFTSLFPFIRLLFPSHCLLPFSFPSFYLPICPFRHSFPSHFYTSLCFPLFPFFTFLYLLLLYRIRPYFFPCLDPLNNLFTFHPLIHFFSLSLLPQSKFFLVLHLFQFSTFLLFLSLSFSHFFLVFFPSF